MTTYLPRSAWTTVPKPAALAPMPPRPVGIAVHWPGTTAPIGHRTQANMAARLEGYRRFHVNGRGWTDIAYQVAIDQDGRVWDLRGIEHESAANGDQTVNRTWLACLLLLGPGEQPGPELLAAFTDWRAARALRKYPTATRIVGHRDIRPTGGTTCPGPITEQLIKTGSLLLEDDMPLTPADAKTLWRADIIPSPDGKDAWQADTYLRKILTEVRALRAATDPATVAAAVLKALPATGAPTQEQLEAALRSVLGSLDDGAA